MRDKLPYHLDKLCIPTSERFHVIQEKHLSCVCSLWGRKNDVSFANVLLLALDDINCNQICEGCVMCSICKPTYRKLGLYTPLPIPSHSWESISMDFVMGVAFVKKLSWLLACSGG